MQSTAPMRTAKIGYIIISIALCILGIILIIVPEFSTSILGILCGIILTLFGVIKLIGFFSKDLYRLAFQYDLALGIMMIIIGIIMLVHPGSLMTFICITLGISFLADGMFKIQIALDSKLFGIQQWWLILICAILTGICGSILIFRPSESSNVLAVILGVSLLVEGFLNLSTILTAVKIIRHQQPNIIDSDYYEESEV